MKRVLIYLLFLIIILIAGVVITIAAMNEDLPETRVSPEADQLAQNMLDAVGYDSFKETRYFAWTFPGQHRYFWDSQDEIVEVRWKSYAARFSTRDHLSGSVRKNGKLVEGSDSTDLLETAWKYYCNDSFWLFAPFKVFDPGTERSLVELENGQKGLMVHYLSGGSTPGDHYLWILDEQFRPKAFKMWVSIIPIGGFEASWESYVQAERGFQLSTEHDLGILTTKITGLSWGDDRLDIGWE